MSDCVGKINGVSYVKVITRSNDSVDFITL